MSAAKKSSLALLVLALFSLITIESRTSAQSDVTNPRSSVQEKPFSPSNSRTEDGKLIPANQFFSAGRCKSCHQDTHQAWSESLHRNAAREPFYKASVDILRNTLGTKPTQHCESCHSPVAVFSGDLLQGANTSHTFEDEGVTCVVCHSITAARLDGTGSYTIRRPALLVGRDGKPIFGDVSDAAILADVPAHKRAMMRPLLKSPEFCGTCHKSVAPPELNSYKFLRGFSAYDEWQQSGASMESITPFYRRDQRFTCNACHMPKTESVNDVAAKNGFISSHRWLGANTITPLFYGQTKQVELTEQFLQSNVLNVDIFALRNETTGNVFTALSTKIENRISLQPNEEIVVDVVIANRKAAHSFPPELRDMYEPWVEFEVIDAAGRTVFHSGFIKPDQTLDESAHVYKAILLDEAGRPITRHQVWLAKIKAYDNFVPQGRCDLARYRFRVPPQIEIGKGLTLRARVNYRRFIQEYTDSVLQRLNVLALRAPVVRMAQAEIRMLNAAIGGKTIVAEPYEGDMSAAQSRRWNDYGIALLEQAQYGPASDAFRQAAKLKPDDPDPLISAAVCELKTERFGIERDQLRKAGDLIAAALKLNPRLPRARFYQALVLRSEGKSMDAASVLMQLSRDYPRDREIQRQLGQTLYALGRIAEARTAFEAIVAIDPNDAGAYQFLAPIYEAEGRKSEASQARSLYLLWRDDPLADVIANRFFSANPNWADERVLAHSHGLDAAPRPTLAGRLAAPDH
jgi:Flp pilus assembly protein TadD